MQGAQQVERTAQAYIKLLTRVPIEPQSSGVGSGSGPSLLPPSSLLFTRTGGGRGGTASSRSAVSSGGRGGSSGSGGSSSGGGRGYSLSSSGDVASRPRGRIGATRTAEVSSANVAWNVRRREEAAQHERRCNLCHLALPSVEGMHRHRGTRQCRARQRALETQEQGRDHTQVEARARDTRRDREHRQEHVDISRALEASRGRGRTTQPGARAGAANRRDPELSRALEASLRDMARSFGTASARTTRPHRPGGGVGGGRGRGGERGSTTPSAGTGGGISATVSARNDPPPPYPGPPSAGGVRDGRGRDGGSGGGSRGGSGGQNIPVAAGDGDVPNCGVVGANQDVYIHSSPEEQRMLLLCGELCGVCFDRYEDVRLVSGKDVNGECTHRFCQVCITNWNQEAKNNGDRTTCPKCRRFICAFEKYDPRPAAFCEFGKQQLEKQQLEKPNAADTGDAGGEVADADAGKLSEFVEELIDGCVDLRFRDELGSTSLMCASANGNSDTVRALLEVDSSVGHIRMKDNEGRTSLIWASSQGFTDAVRALLEADPSMEHTRMTTNDGMTALDWAQNDETKAVLRASESGTAEVYEVCVGKARKEEGRRGGEEGKDAKTGGFTCWNCTWENAESNKTCGTCGQPRDRPPPSTLTASSSNYASASTMTGGEAKAELGVSETKEGSAATPLDDDHFDCTHGCGFTAPTFIAIRQHEARTCPGPLQEQGNQGDQEDQELRPKAVIESEEDTSYLNGYLMGQSSASNRNRQGVATRNQRAAAGHGESTPVGQLMSITGVSLARAGTALRKCALQTVESAAQWINDNPEGKKEQEGGTEEREECHAFAKHGFCKHGSRCRHLHAGRLPLRSDPTSWRGLKDVNCSKEDKEGGTKRKGGGGGGDGDEGRGNDKADSSKRAATNDLKASLREPLNYKGGSVALGDPRAVSGRAISGSSDVGGGSMGGSSIESGSIIGGGGSRVTQIRKLASSIKGFVWGESSGVKGSSPRRMSMAKTSLLVDMYRQLPGLKKTIVGTLKYRSLKAFIVDLGKSYPECGLRWERGEEDGGGGGGSGYIVLMSGAAANGGAGGCGGGSSGDGGGDRGDGGGGKGEGGTDAAAAGAAGTAATTHCPLCDFQRPPPQCPQGAYYGHFRKVHADACDAKGGNEEHGVPRRKLPVRTHTSRTVGVHVPTVTASAVNDGGVAATAVIMSCPLCGDFQRPPPQHPQWPYFSHFRKEHADACDAEGGSEEHGVPRWNLPAE